MFQVALAICVSPSSLFPLLDHRRRLFADNEDPRGEKENNSFNLSQSTTSLSGITNAVIIKELQITPHNIISYQLSMSHKFAMALFPVLGPTSTFTSLTVVLPSSFRWALIDRQPAAYLLPGE